MPSGAVDEAITAEKGVRQSIASEAARLYLNALRVGASVEGAEAGIKLVEAALRFAEERNPKGLKTGSEIRRSKFDLAAARQKQLNVQSE